MPDRPSLDALREAWEAFIADHNHEGPCGSGCALTLIGLGQQAFRELAALSAVVEAVREQALRTPRLCANILALLPSTTEEGT